MESAVKIYSFFHASIERNKFLYRQSNAGNNYKGNIEDDISRRKEKICKNTVFVIIQPRFRWNETRQS
jgi:hypothetical protein